MAFSLQYKGFDYVAFYNGAYEDSDSLPSLVQTGANSIEATLDYGIDVATSQVVADPNYTDSLAALGNTIAQAESLGMSVMVRPLIDFLNPAEIAPYSVGEWRQDYQPTNVAAFFASYQQMIVAEAQVAQQNGAQMLSIGAELDQLAGPQYLSYWTSIISAVHAVFSGQLTYSASWSTASNVSFWSQLNYEGIDCYVPLSNAQNPTLQELINGWTEPATEATNPAAYAVIGNQSPIQYFENLAAQSGKPLLFTELGYANDSGAAADPSASGNSPNPALQAELYQAFFQAWGQSGNSSLIGAYFWEWDPNGSTSNVGPGIDSFSPQNSPAQSAATAGFDTQYWITGTTGVWSQAADWQSGVVPTSANDAVINNSNAVMVNGTAVANTLSLYDSTLNVSGTLTLGTLLTVDNNSTLELSGGTLSAPSITADSVTYGDLVGYGTVNGPVSGAVYITADGGILKMQGSLAGDQGNFYIDTGATLELSSGTAQPVYFAGPSATLKLDAPTAFTGSIGSIIVGDTIDLAGITASSATYSGSTLTINETNGQKLIYDNVNGSVASDTVAVASDNNGGTLVYWGVLTVSVAGFIANETSLNSIAGGFAISDTAAAVEANLAALTADAGHITSITATGGQVIVGNGLFVADAAALNEIVGGFTIVGQASVLQGNLSGLEADISHINSITGLNGTITATVAQFLSDETALNEVVGGFAISDTAANVENNLGALAADANHIALIQATGGQVVVGNGLFVADQAVLNEIVGGFSIVGQASVLQGNLSGLEADISHINSITGLNGTITATVAQFLSDETALNEVVGGFAISDTAANVENNLGALAADANHIALIQATGGQVVVGNGLFVADQAALNEIVGGFTIVGQASVLSGNLSGLEADISHINSITGLNGTITATVAQFLGDLSALNKVVGGYDVNVPSGYNIDVTINGATNISNAVLIPSGTVGLIFDGTTAQNITMTTEEYNSFSAITLGTSATAANSTVTFTDGGTVAGNSNVLNYTLAANDTITTGNGNNTITGSGAGDTITTGSGNDFIQVTGGLATINPGLGTNTIMFAGSGNLIVNQGGTDTLTDTGTDNTIVIPLAGQGQDTIHGSVLANGDTFDLRAALASTTWDQQLSDIGDYLTLGTSGSNTLVQISSTSGGTPITVAVLVGQGAVSLSDFITHALLT